MNVLIWKSSWQAGLAVCLLILGMVAPASANEVEIGDHVVHYNVITTDLLSRDVARAYGLSRSRNRALINIVVMHRDEAGTTRSVPARVQGTGVNLNQQSRAMRFREIRDGDAYYHLAEVPVRRGEVIDFRLQIRAEGQTEPMDVRFRQAFFAH